MLFKQNYHKLTVSMSPQKKNRCVTLFHGKDFFLNISNVGNSCCIIVSGQVLVYQKDDLYTNNQGSDGRKINFFRFKYEYLNISYAQESRNKTCFDFACTLLHYALLNITKISL
jgi:hypothetical protein